MTMGPICIANDLKRQGFGKMLLDYSIEKARELGCGALCFEGNIDFYGKSGFTYAKDFGISYNDMPEDEDTSFFLCKELIKGYLIDENEAEIFDEQFPKKEKLKLPGQLF